MNHRKAVSILLAGTVAAFVTALTIGPVSASPNTDHKVTLCHATASVSNPYVQITVGIPSVKSFEHDLAEGHGTHVGPIFDPNGGKDQPPWGDIIPAFGPWQFGDDTLTYGGMNVPAGDGILANGCEAPGPPPSPSPVYHPTARFIGPCGDPREKVVYNNRRSTGSVTFKTYRAGSLVQRTTLTVAAGATRTTHWFHVHRGQSIVVRARGHVIASTVIGRTLRC